MRRAAALLVLLPACAVPAAPPPARTDFADALIARSSLPAVVHLGSPAPTTPLIVAGAASDPLAGLVAVSPARRDALTAAPLDAVLAAGVTPGELAFLAATRSPSVAAARQRREAARTQIAQSRDLAELVGSVAVVAGDAARRRGHDGVAPRADDRSPGVDTLSAELARRGVGLANEELRASVRDAVVSAVRLHADAQYVIGLRALLTTELDVFDAVLEVLRVRQESGLVGEAAVASMASRRARVRTQLAALADREHAVAAGWNALLSRRTATAVPLAPRPGADPLAVDVVILEHSALQTDPGVRAARLRVERAELAVRLAETMTTGPVDARPGDVRSPPLSFGVRAAQINELRARAAAARDALTAAEDSVIAGVRRATAAYDEAGRLRTLHRSETVPLAERAREAVRASFEAGRATSAELLLAFDDVLTAKQALIAAERDISHTHAALIRAAGHEHSHGGFR